MRTGRFGKPAAPVPWAPARAASSRAGTASAARRVRGKAFLPVDGVPATLRRPAAAGQPRAFCLGGAGSHLVYAARRGALPRPHHREATQMTHTPAGALTRRSALALGTAGLAAPAIAQSPWPSRPVTLVV